LWIEAKRLQQLERERQVEGFAERRLGLRAFAALRRYAGGKRDLAEAAGKWRDGTLSFKVSKGVKERIKDRKRGARK
jgi:hypothetical protein